MIYIRRKIDRLDKFNHLNPIEQLFADDNLEEVRKLDVVFGSRFSEICAHFGAHRCFSFLLEGGYDLSPQINLHRIKRDEDIISFVSHPNELYYALVYGRDELIPFPNAFGTHTQIRKPSIYTALRTLIKLLNDHIFDMIDYTSKIYSLYTPREWSMCVSRCRSDVISTLIEHGLFHFFDGSHLGHSAIPAIKRATRRERRELATRCLLPITYLRGRRPRRAV